MKSPVYTRARTGSSALVPGITLFRELGSDNYPRWRVRASAQVTGKQRTRSWGVVQRWTLAEALREAARYRAQYQEEAGTEKEILQACWDAIDDELREEMRGDGVDVSRPARGAGS